MKRNFGQLFFGVCCFLVSFVFFGGVKAQNPDALDQQNGFLDVRLGDSLTHFKDLRRAGSYMKKDKYVKDKDVTTYADIGLKSVHYLFYKGRLHSIQIKTEGEKNSHAFLDVLRMYYGDGEQDAMAPNFEWNGKKVRLTYEENLFTKNAEVFFISREVEHIFSQEWKIITH